METLIDIFIMIGTVSFAVSGALKAIKYEMDLFGVAMLALINAVGGGAIRDIIIGELPPSVFANPIYPITAIAVALIVFIIAYFTKKMSDKVEKAEKLVLLFTDTLGLSIFTVIGINTATGVGITSVSVLLFVGVITGTGGGILSDIFSGIVPNIFRRHIYALASIIGATADIILSRYIPATSAMITGFALVFVIRMLAASFKWDLPKIKKNQ